MISSIFLPSVKGYNISKLSDGKYSVAVNNGNMGACQMDKQQFDEFISKQKEQGNVSASKGKSVLIGAGIATLAVVAGVVLKNRKAAKALAEEAKKFGFEDVQLFKQLKNEGFRIKKIEQADYETVFNNLKDVVAKSSQQAEKSILMSGNKFAEYLKGVNITGKLPENSFAHIVEFNQGDPHSTIFVYDKMCDSLLDVCGNAWKDGKILVQNIKH